MGEPAEPTPKERAERVALGRSIVDAVRNDEDSPLLAIDCADLDLAIFGLAQEVEMLDIEKKALKAELLSEIARILPTVEDGKR